MRDYAKAEPKMWHGQTFKALRKTHEGLLVAMYLMTSPSSSMLGLFAQPILYMAHETGLGEEGARKGLQCCIDAGYCSYDEESEFVWVHEMAAYQIAQELKANDKRCLGIQKDYEALPANPFLDAWYDRYSGAFHLKNRRLNDGSKEGAYRAPPKPLPSQEQEQEQEQDKEHTNTDVLVAASGAEPPGLFPDESPPACAQCPHQEIIALYHRLLPALPAIRDWTPARADTLRVRWKEEKARHTLVWWERFFEYVGKSKFLTGRASGTNGKPFLPGLEWILKAENFAKIREGRYHEDAA